MDDSTREEVTRLLTRGLNHYGLAEIEAAIACWEKAKELDPRNRAAHDYLETAYEESKAEPVPLPVSEAFEDDDTPRSVDPGPSEPAERPVPDEQPDTVLAQALDAYKSGHLDTAWETLRGLADSQPDRLDVQGYLAMVRSERARQWARAIGDQGRVLRVTRST